ncbi:fungal-specific transcription factor domain-containing protein [Daldinia caldariorum]|uniref:fungal-specific transcription factor domain-containing protein n=1 Tax=Daldinia caldariorum TaxID=326644 RepID=UPI00200761D4|nr:fungal-specific transcription factor domain-containing protein [Daldinia caldariorum]KAI1464601.1 fungal-specific transcription factor domain-containing protein [Daldinia caldariorum]
MPACQKCLSNGETCSYDKAPSIAYAVSLQDELQAYKNRIEELRRVKDKDRDALLNEPMRTINPNGGRSRAFRSPPDLQSYQQLDSVPAENMDYTTEMASVGTDGRVNFYGKTSLYHVDPKHFEEHSPTSISSYGDSTGTHIHDMAAMPSIFEFHDIASLLAEIPHELLNDLLDTYWCYPHHFHCVLCKPLFLRDLYTPGPYVTPFLLCAVLAQAARYSTRRDATEVGQTFASRALQLLPSDIDKGSSIPTIQGLLILSARECACGRVSQGWLYSGTAFRMMRDLGIDISPRKLGHLAKQFTEEELAVRKQVFWSCYTWDKTMSLCLGRAPAVHCSVELPTRDTLLYGHDADDEVWPPVTTHNSFVTSLVEQKSLSSTRFVAYCELSVIIENILDTLYSRPHNRRQDDLLAYMNMTLQRLQSWADQLPPEIFIQDTTSTAIVSPPLYILLLNLTYQAATILLCRPYRTLQPTAKKRCTKAAKMADTLLMLHVKRFGFRYITYLETYTLFVACTVNVLDFTENEASAGDLGLAREANARLHFGLEILRQANSTPVAARCASTICQLFNRQKASMRNANTERGSEQETSQATADSSSPSELGINPNAQTFMPTPASASASFQQPSLAVAEGEFIISSIVGSEIPYIQDGHTDTNADGDNTTFQSHIIPVETPLRWLPENVQDDGSWMLMTADGDFNGDFDLEPIAGLS